MGNLNQHPMVKHHPLLASTYFVGNIHLNEQLVKISSTNIRTLLQLIPLKEKISKGKQLKGEIDFHLLNFHFAAAGTSTGGKASFFHPARASNALKWITVPVLKCLSISELLPNTISGMCDVSSFCSHLHAFITCLKDSLKTHQLKVTVC